MPSKKATDEVDIDPEKLKNLSPGSTSHRFEKWGDPEIKPDPGIYTVWDECEKFIYVGMAGRGVQASNTADVADTEDPDKPKPKRKKGLLGRLYAHQSGLRSGDQFCVYVCDYFVVPKLTKGEQDEIAAGTRFLDDLTQDYIYKELSYRFIYLPDGKTAEAWERKIRAGEFSELGTPFLNPIPARRKRRAKR